MKIDTNLSDIFDIELANTDKPLDLAKIDAIKDDTATLERQREYVRNNMVELIERGKSALDNLNQSAMSSEKTRDFEVMATLIKTLVETNTTLLDIEVAHKKPTQVPGSDGEGGQTATTINNNAVFIGSTADLSKYIKETMRPPNGDIIDDVK